MWTPFFILVLISASLIHAFIPKHGFSDLSYTTEKRHSLKKRQYDAPNAAGHGKQADSSTKIEDVMNQLNAQAQQSGVACASDVLFVLDATGSMKQVFDDSLQYIAKVLEGLTISPDGDHVGLVEYSSLHKQREKIPLGSITEPARLTKAVLALPFFSGVTATGAALEFADHALRLRRPNVRTSVVVITDGYSYDTTETSAETLRKHPNTFTYVVSIGNIFLKSGLEEIAGSEKRVLYGPSTYGQLVRFIKACHGDATDNDHTLSRVPAIGSRNLTQMKLTPSQYTSTSTDEKGRNLIPTTHVPEFTGEERRAHGPSTITYDQTPRHTPTSRGTTTPASARSTTSTPTTATSTTSTSATTRSRTSAPATTRSTTSRPATTRSTASTPTTATSTTSTPATTRSRTSTPATTRSTTSRPATTRSTTSTQITGRSTTSTPVTARSTTGTTVTARSTTGTPATTRSTTGTPATARNTTGTPTTARSTTGTPNTAVSGKAGAPGMAPSGYDTALSTDDNAATETALIDDVLSEANIMPARTPADNQTQPKCRFDIVLVFDSSSSPPKGFQEQLDAAGRVVDTFDVGPNATQVAAVEFAGDRKNVLFGFTDSPDKLSTKKKLASTKYQGGKPHTNEALLKSADMIRGDTRAPKPKSIVVVFTTGDSKEDPSRGAEQLRRVGATIYVLADDNGQKNRVELELIAGSPSRVYITSKVSALVDELHTVQLIC
ncbi:unnamed protein product [Cylicocyclus nassatus]|uniref:VWFA domain-containing protein n=1 Tax=Cylicocyclus nassatus TaxID=53992 RepID=A0AA36HG53_CYLNA|nr:unnamed protein product [Cylicocyclus nassatus]